MEQIINEYKENGFYIKKNLFSSEFCNEYIDNLNKKKAIVNIPFTNIKWGFGNLIDVEPYCNIKNEPFIKEFNNYLFDNKYDNAHIYVHNKSKWVGCDIEWHQEVFNINSYHPINKKQSEKEILNNYLQIYIALDKQTLENGCLKIFPKSHKLGILDHQDIVNSFFNHKRRVSVDSLDKINKHCNIKNLNLNKGDVVFFNHLLVHGSTNNNSPYERKAIVYQTRRQNIASIDETILKKEKEYRKNFVKNILNKINGV
jgi:hypothetical protein